MAEALFREGRALLEAGDAARACGKLADSYRLDPRLGTLMNLAACHEMEGKLATAWAEFLEASRQARGRERSGAKALEDTARGRAEALAGRIHTVELAVDAPSPELVVLVDGREIPATAWRSFPIDAGNHAVEARRAHHVSWSLAFDVPATPGRSTVHVPALSPSPSTASASAVPAAAEALPPRPPASRSRLESPFFWGATALAVASVGIGTYFGLEAVSMKESRDRECTDDGCSPAGLVRQSEAINASRASTVLFVVGGVAAVIAVAVLVWPARTPARRGADALRVANFGRF